MNCSNFVRLRKTIKESRTSSRISLLHGILINDTGYYYPFIDFNQFGDKTKLPSGYQIEKIDSKNYCDFSKNLLTKNNKEYKKIREKFKGSKSYFIMDNGGSPFLVYVGDKVGVYTLPTKKYYISRDTNVEKWQYIQHLKTFSPKKVFIGKSPKTPMTEFSGGYGRRFTGNSILLQMSLHRYVYIGSEIYEFTTTDVITDYVSEVGNNSVPYPVAFGSENVYFMAESSFIPRKLFPPITKKVKNVINDYFYGKNSINSKFVKKIKKKIIQKRL